MVPQIGPTDHRKPSHNALKRRVPATVSQKPTHCFVGQDLLLRNPIHYVTSFFCTNFKLGWYLMGPIYDVRSYDPHEGVSTIDQAVPKLYHLGTCQVDQSPEADIDNRFGRLGIEPRHAIWVAFPKTAVGCQTLGHITYLSIEEGVEWSEGVNFGKHEGHVGET